MSNLSKKFIEKELEEKVKEILKNPREFVNRRGLRFSETISYSEAFNFVCEENPELAKAYAEFLRPSKLTPEEEKSLAAGQKIVALVNEKKKADKGLSYSEALTEVQRENRELILEYIGRK